MKIKLIFILLIFFCMIGVVYGGNNTTINYTYTVNMDYDVDIFDKVYALEDGHFNTSFSDGFYGYCVEYGETEAVKGDMFLVDGTDSIRNSVTGKECGDYLKVYFVDYYGDAQRDKIVTQHMIWHFTDNFNGWRLNYTLIDLIKDKVDNQGVHYSDSGYRVLSDNLSVMFWDFHSFLSPYINHQDYFGYHIWFGNISDIPVENETMNNNTTIIDNTTIDNVTVDNSTNTSILNNTKNNTVLKDNIINYNYNIINNYNRLYSTGWNIWLLVCISILLILILITRRKKSN